MREEQQTPNLAGENSDSTVNPFHMSGMEVKDEIWVIGEPSDLVLQVLEIAQISSVDVIYEHIETDIGNPRLVICCDKPTVKNSAIKVPAGLRRIQIGNGNDADAEINLPSQAGQLAAVLLQTEKEYSANLNNRAVPVTMVYGWHPGAPTEVAAARLAAIENALCLEATGHIGWWNPDAKPTPDLHWGMIDPDDPPRMDELLMKAGRSGDIKTVRQTLPNPVGINDRRVMAILHNSNVPVVIDCGVWTPAVEQAHMRILGLGRQVKTVIVGKTDKVNDLMLGNVLSTMEPYYQPNLLLNVGKTNAETATCSWLWDMQIEPMPSERTSRPLRKMTPSKRQKWQNIRNIIWQQEQIPHPADHYDMAGSYIPSQYWHGDQIERK